jgi:RNA polymerase sigma-70 factor, ECF subfamily
MLGVLHTEEQPRAVDQRTGANNDEPLDQDLVSAIAGGDQSALARLYDRYSGLVYSVALRVLRDTASAEEILQDIFMQLWRKASQFDAQRGSLPAWLLVMARNRAISRLRQRNPTGETSMEEGTEALAALPSRLDNSMDNFLIGQQMIGKVRAAMDGLPAVQHEALEMAYFEGLTHSEIAERTGEPLGTIKTRVRSAVQTLREKFN